MKVLIIGAGATGTVLGYFAREAGAEVTFLVKEKYEKKLKEGITLHHHRTFRGEPVTRLFKEFEVRAQISELAGKSFDAILCTVPSNALNEGKWLNELIETLPGVTFVSFQPGIDDRKTILDKTNLSAENFLESSIPFLSYLAPMPGETNLAPGYAFWIPPTSKGYFNGESGRAQKIVKLLQEGGYPAKYQPRYKEKQLAMETLLSILVIGLEKADWSFDKLFNSDKLYIVSKATEEAFPLVYQKRTGELPKNSFIRDLIFKGLIIQTALRMMEFLAPFDLEQFFQIHYTKIDAQRKGEFEAILGLKPRESLGTSLTLLRSKS
jgi:hypothetical protein